MNGDDRRKYFRIEQRVSLEFKVITEADITEQHPSPTQFEVSPNFLLLSQLQKMEAESSDLLQKIAEKDSDIAAFLELTHSKIERIAQAVASTEMKISSAAIQEVNISEGGLQFHQKTNTEKGTFLSLKLVFPESSIGLLLYAQCCRCDAIEDGSYLTSVEFIKMPESCRTILARQILESQAREIKRISEEKTEE